MITGINIKTRREALNLKQEEFATAVEISMATLTRWEAGDVKPPDYFEYVMRYVEQNIDAIRAGFPKRRSVIKRSGSVIRGGSMQERFEEKTAKTDTDCLAWMGAHSFNVGDGSTASPRKVAWFLHFGEFPAQEIKLLCTTKSCVAWQHLTLGRESNAGNQAKMTNELKRQIIDAIPELGVKGTAKKFSVSVGTVSNIKNNK